jgi:hypothetical protein
MTMLNIPLVAPAARLSRQQMSWFFFLFFFINSSMQGWLQGDKDAEKIRDRFQLTDNQGQTILLWVGTPWSWLEW